MARTGFRLVGVGVLPCTLYPMVAAIYVSKISCRHRVLAAKKVLHQRCFGPQGIALCQVPMWTSSRRCACVSVGWHVSRNDLCMQKNSRAPVICKTATKKRTDASIDSSGGPLMSSAAEVIDVDNDDHEAAASAIAPAKRRRISEVEALQSWVAGENNEKGGDSSEAASRRMSGRLAVLREGCAQWCVASWHTRAARTREGQLFLLQTYAVRQPFPPDSDRSRGPLLRDGPD